MIDSARIYDRALSGGEIAALAADATETSDSFGITVGDANVAPTFFAGDGTAVTILPGLSSAAVDVAVTDCLMESTSLPVEPTQRPPGKTLILHWSSTTRMVRSTRPLGLVGKSSQR